MKDKIAIIGSGAMGTAFGKVLSDAGNKNIMFYGVDKNELSELEKGINTKYFPNSIELPKFSTTTDLTEALDGAKYIVVAVPSKVMSIVFPQIVGTVTNEALVLCVSKGFYPGTQMSLHEKMTQVAKPNKNIRGVVSLIGPSHAEEIVLETPTTICSVDSNKKLCEEVQELCSNKYMRVYIQTDVKGAEVGASYKNVLAIASGMVNGLGFGINSTAALLTRGMAEMARFNKAMKGKKETIMGLTGLGDLIVTATSNLSRNYTFGKDLATKGREAALSSNATIEGLLALEVIHNIAEEKELNLPIIEYVYNVVHGKADPKDFYKDFLNRELTNE